ncbi:MULTISPECIES: histidinol-phosphate transaminase [unclassified Variovorax]|uniref:histidinol-phosphate transaminase n=1 Tax=unclassified Variovorax TaxID=663243 RepID=UPI00076D2026|nr:MULTISPECIES: histidinol-phosphate transaminase [unclassified Variovorax]KWT97427.1 Histidinol-phosphate aminotransferase [Variovorax sp. WDL1]PNG60097.1 Histidinol-phosphate aminotransferase 2 [Variovorax sp. B4]PNG60110.1 Histidinol-phosphate aminotransferase 2 [Variovorax sp. B2]VTV14081.1 Histidinol-phosphate aminotransferase 2 [Variovorax sp. WDL1]
MTSASDDTTRALSRIRADVQSMHAYAVQDARGLLKLDAMENPFGLPPALQAALGQRLGALALNRYPGPRSGDLQRALAAYAGLPEGFGLMLGNGSDELISLLAMACDLPGAAILAPEPGFVMYAMSARLQGLRFVGVPLTADFELDEAAMLAAIAREKPAIVYLAYPNNPTANLWDDAVIEKIVQAQGAQGGLVVIDEAYQPFAARSYIDRMERHGHVLLMRTLSKFGLAGVRLGYLVGPQALIAEVDKVRPPYNISVLNCECALFALEHAEVFAEQAARIRAGRTRIFEALAGLPGVRSWPSEANMILVRVPDAARTFEGMKSRGVLIKNVSRMHPLLANCLRLTVGTAEENAQMLAALEASL